MNSSTPSRRAVIDIGTNSVKLLVAEVAGMDITPTLETSKQTRLGAGFYETRRMQPGAIHATAEAVAEFSKEAQELGALPARVIATSAARDALNAGELAEAVRLSSGLAMEILTGDQEAEWVFRGVTSDPKLARSPVLVLDVGGGSTEFIVGDNATPQFRNSYSLGTVRLIEQLNLGEPPGMDALTKCRASLREFMLQQVAPALEKGLQECRQPVRLVGTGGTATILARIETGLTHFDRVRLEAAQVGLGRISAHLDEQWQMTLAQRQLIPGMPAKRADVILTGMAIYEAIMAQFGFSQLEVSTRGLRYWALRQN